MQTEKASSAFSINDVGFSAIPRHFSNAAAETVARGPGPVSFSVCFNVLFINNTPPTNNSVTWSSLGGKLMLHLSCIIFFVHVLSYSEVRSPRLRVHSVHSCHIALRPAARWMPCAVTFSRAVTEPCAVKVVETSLGRSFSFGLHVGMRGSHTYFRWSAGSLDFIIESDGNEFSLVTNQKIFIKAHQLEYENCSVHRGKPVFVYLQTAVFFCVCAFKL